MKPMHIQQSKMLKQLIGIVIHVLSRVNCLSNFCTPSSSKCALLKPRQEDCKEFHVWCHLKYTLCCAQGLDQTFHSLRANNDIINDCTIG
jgi:hypothetical protein